MSNLKETKVYSINDFLNWNESKELQLSPKYQRNNVWNSKAESYLIDTILRGLPIPQVFLRQTIDTKIRKTYREVIDGQQRLRTIVKFEKNEFPIMKAHNSELAGMYYRDLDEDMQMQFLDYQIPVELIKTSDDSVVYDMFMRVNTNSNTLNKQELRNAKYWGDFKVLVYKLASEWRNFFAEFSIFKDSDFIRMVDAEYISSLLILLREGIVQDTPAKIDMYYKKFDNGMYDSEESEALFKEVMRDIKTLFDKTQINFRYINKKNYFYTLFAYQLLLKGKLRNTQYSIPNQYNGFMLDKVLVELESQLSLDEDLRSEEMNQFLHLHSSRTTNENERKERVRIFSQFVERVIRQYGN
ncbi:DUF262 domain-containing protein [Neobacillus kokaensis]|uniref:GmrSD restriction endonucleases N-terminal domain-containing protein n=1 Tax=Neobacillus kokaensis TaxID=2759023 RepID=A0ABQ3N7D7_9BACI|nr:DUF262 domain-containing protein [Neobacillus kokaensis]GHI00630.1 hypothetical protein AM1BK_41720 [Neobacillus kokaensis]